MLRQLLALLCAVPALILHRVSPGVRILMYHRVTESREFDQLTVTPGRFAEQMSILAAAGNVVSLKEAVESLQKGAAVAKNSVVITFDDGYLDNLEQALPILERYQLPASIFVTTDFAAHTSSHPRYSDEGGSRLHLDWAQLRELVSHPLITLGSHTVSHPYLQSVDDSQSREEITESASILEKELGIPMDYFCYPSGDYGARELNTIRDSAYQAAVTVAPGVNRHTQSLLELNRSEVTDKDSKLMFRCKLIGAFDILHAVLHMRRKWQFSRQAEQKLSGSKL